ncbi:MAG: hypothetical protein ABIQ60_14995 [Burkholderiaceae bacterium]
MSITSIAGVVRASAPATDTAPPNAASRSGAHTSTVEVDQATQQPLPPRYPWLSRLSHQLETAARQRPAFAPTPILGDHVDRSA